MADTLRHLILPLAEAGAAAFAVGLLGYVAISFGLMRGHTEARGSLAHLREALREAAWAVLIQPLLPLFYFVGRRMGGGARGGVPVVFVHGYMQNRVDFLRIARNLARAGSGPLYGFNYPWFATVPSNAKRLARFVDRVRAETGAAEVDLVCHSLGGVVAMEYFATEVEAGGANGASYVRRCVTIASPLAGVVWRGPILGACGPAMRSGSDLLRAHAERALPLPCLSIYSTHDNVVHPPSTSTVVPRGGRDCVVPHASHLAILFHRRVAEATTAFLVQADEEAAAGTRALDLAPTAGTFLGEELRAPAA